MELSMLSLILAMKSSSFERSQLSLFERKTPLSHHDGSDRDSDDDLRFLRAPFMAYTISKRKLEHLALRGLSIKAFGKDLSTLQFDQFWDSLSATDSRSYQLKSELFNNLETLELQPVIPRRGEDDHPSLPPRDRKPPRAGSRSASSLKEERSSTPTTTQKTSAHQTNPNRDKDKALEEAFAHQLELATTELQMGKRNFLAKAGHDMPLSDNLAPTSSDSGSGSGSADPRSAKKQLDALTAQCRNVASLCATRHGNPDPNNTTPTTTLTPTPLLSASSTSSFPTTEPEPEPDPRVPYHRRVASILQRHSDPRQALPRLERALQPYLVVRGEKGEDDGLNDEMIRQYRHAIKAMEEEIADLYRVPPAGAAD
ncbi:hypothetical protein EPUS_00583 [Endocarpon pusillum Z07020]|uniref:Uncharacterized protein n=1 Tax=Endocarpon pusillum (strain Z07020 / HMAS-L-300199) TaxID=1263415 RepID=U1HR59_ENDPU|nr:uncharacterized protein EPUS_00583 [Endocarpon pusillum Z07020]ERF71594.1 hypothetical protein EPUS_00583 [Endocarpon pusillum Z07020]